MKYNIPAILFAGGQSSRMGKDKALLPFAGYSTLSEYQYERLNKLFTTVYISAKENKFNFEAPLIKDRYKASSPLVGIVSLFETLDADEVFILSVDAPFVTKEVISKLLKNREGYDAIIAKTKSGRQPLCGIYKRSVLAIALKYLKEDEHRLGTVLNNVDTKFVFFEDDSVFTNMNHPHEYEEALKSLD